MRFWMGMPPQIWYAACAELMASSTSEAVQHGAKANTSPVLESVTSMYLSVFDSIHSPSTKYFSLMGSATVITLPFLYTVTIT